MHKPYMKKFYKCINDMNREIKVNRPILYKKLFGVILFIFLLICTKKYFIPNPRSRMMNDEIYKYINESVDKCLQHKNRYDQNKEFSSLQTTLPLKPLKMTLNTAVFLYTETSPPVVLKRIIINKVTPIYEDKIALTLRHEHIVKSYQSEVSSYKGNTILWLTMEYLPIKIMYSNIKRNEDRIREIAYDILQGLKYLHSHGIAHLDLKISNVMGIQTKNGVEYKIIDFGYSRVVKEESVIPNKNYGTFPYKPPEIVLNNIHGLKSDIWCTGSILLFLKLGYTPWYNSEGKKDKVMYQKFLQGKYKIAYPSDISPELKDLIRACMQLDRTKRPSAKTLLTHAFFQKNGFMFSNPDSESSEYDSSYYDTTDESLEMN